MSAVRPVKRLFEHQHIVGDLVFVKVQGYRPWPGRITGFFPATKKYGVFFFGTYDIARVVSKAMFAYTEANKDKFGKPQRRLQEKFEKALKEIEDLHVKRQNELAMELSFNSDLVPLPDADDDADADGVDKNVLPALEVDLENVEEAQLRMEEHEDGAADVININISPSMEVDPTESLEEAQLELGHQETKRKAPADNDEAKQGGNEVRRIKTCL